MVNNTLIQVSCTHNLNDIIIISLICIHVWVSYKYDILFLNLNMFNATLKETNERTNVLN